MKEATQAADLDEALKLRAALESVQRDRGITGPQDTACLPVGRWRVAFSNGVNEQCAIQADGSLSVVEPQRSSNGRATVRDSSFLIVCQEDRLERWTPVGQNMVVEHWFPMARFPSAPRCWVSLTGLLGSRTARTVRNAHASWPTVLSLMPLCPAIARPSTSRGSVA